MTLGENIGDNGGLNIAFRALQNVMKTEKLGVKDGFTPEQRFFLAWARVWAGNARPEYLQYLMTVDVAAFKRGSCERCPPNGGFMV